MEDPIGRHRGKVRVLLLGMPGCEATGRATAFLQDFARRVPAGAALVKLDVPPPGMQVDWGPDPDLGLEHHLDSDRSIAHRLEFFYYPTLYILDGDGEVRFQGGCEPDEVERMVEEIASETDGSPRHVYTQRSPRRGDVAPPFGGTTADGLEASLSSLRGGKATMLFFGSLWCPFSREAVAGLAQLRSGFGGQGADFAIINVGNLDPEGAAFYAEHAPGIPVVADGARHIAEAYGVRTVPFFYTVDPTGKIDAGRPFTFNVARRALQKLGLECALAEVHAGEAG
ncbi:MAG: redoxin domain-containing protein [Planctomycetota bacterium]|jgi:peroxiredoxin